jgi:hypothetical protein
MSQEVSANKAVDCVGYVCLFTGLGLMSLVLWALYLYTPKTGQSFSVSWAPIDIYLLVLSYHILFRRSRTAFRLGRYAVAFLGFALVWNAGGLTLMDYLGASATAPFPSWVFQYAPVLLLFGIPVAALYRNSGKVDVLTTTADDIQLYGEKKNPWKLFRACPALFQGAMALYTAAVIYGFFSFMQKLFAG